MSSDNKPVLRRKDSVTAASLPLVKWDKNGSVVVKAKGPAAPTKAPLEESVAEVQQETIKAPTVKELESIREDAYNEGFEQGFENGMAQGQRAGHSEGHPAGFSAGQQEGLEQGLAEGAAEGKLDEETKGKEKLAVFDALTAAFKEQMPHEQAELEQALLALSIRIARQVVQDELRAEPHHIAAVVHAAVQSLPNPDDKLTLYVNPGELDYVTSFADKHWQLEADAAVSSGGCKIKSQYSYIDYTLEHRFDTAVTHLMSQLGDENAQAAQSPLSDETLIAEPSQAEVPETDLTDPDLESDPLEPIPEQAAAEVESLETDAESVTGKGSAAEQMAEIEPEATADSTEVQPKELEPAATEDVADVQPGAEEPAATEGAAEAQPAAAEPVMTEYPAEAQPAATESESPRATESSAAMAATKPMATDDLPVAAEAAVSEADALGEGESTQTESASAQVEPEPGSNSVAEPVVEASGNAEAPESLLEPIASETIHTPKPDIKIAKVEPEVASGSAATDTNVTPAGSVRPELNERQTSGLDTEREGNNE